MSNHTTYAILALALGLLIALSGSAIYGNNRDSGAALIVLGSAIMVLSIALFI
jgi:hypothetical protein